MKQDHARGGCMPWCATSVLQEEWQRKKVENEQKEKVAQVLVVSVKLWWIVK